MTGLLRILPVLAAVLACAGTLRADTFVYLDQDGNEQTVEAKLAGTGQGAMALEKADGQITLVAESFVRDRKPAAGPDPVDAKGMVKVLEDHFGADHVRTSIDEPFVIALVLSAPLDRRSERQVTGFVTRASRFMSNVETVFTRFMKDMRIPLPRSGLSARSADLRIGHRFQPLRDTRHRRERSLGFAHGGFLFVAHELARRADEFLRLV